MVGLMDRDQIDRVLTNLLENAIAYSHAGSIVYVRADKLKAPCRLRIAVSDQGPGIPPEARPYLFKRFFRIEGSSAQSRPALSSTVPKGTGLGLAVCKTIVELHGGDIGVENQTGHGATFWFTLPQPPGQLVNPLPDE